MTIHLTKRVEIYCSDEDDSCYIEQDKEFDGIEITFGKSWVGEQQPRISISKEMASKLVEALEEIL
ncbi:hypothetical protein vBVpaMR16F_63 [Vibrio phage vB_VpaM_R16F]|nr:hypothetical protein vBVpaMR16F_63 [Vibrio phage vB_VpaM_R16F]